MSNYPSAIDDASSLYSPANRTSTNPLSTTLTANALSGDATLQVASTTGFPATYGILRIGDETIVYAAKTATTFTGCIRGAGGSTAAAHSSGAVVRALFDALFLVALQAAVVAIETQLGVTGAFNFAAVAHAHAGTDITSGTVAATRLPTATGATAVAAGTAGILPAPPAGTITDVLRRDLTWGAGGGGSTTASAVTFTPTGTIEATNVQAAIAELDTEKAAASHNQAATTISVASGVVPAGNAQERIEDLWTDKADKSVFLTAGAGMTGGGDLSGDVSFAARVVSVHGRDGNVDAAAGDYTATQVDITPSGWPGWMGGASTVASAINAIINKIANLESSLSSYLTTSVAASTYLTQSTHNAHSHNLNVNANGGHNHGGEVSAEADHIHTGNTTAPV